MSHSSSAQLFSAAETTFAAPLGPVSRSRTRTLSLLSISSGNSLRSLYEIKKGQSTVIVSHQPEKHEAWGSFIPLRPATTSLRELISVSSSYSIQSSPKRRQTPSHDIQNTHWQVSSSPKPKVPYITRTLPSSPVCPPSSTSSSSFMISHHVQSDLDPILAQLERKSKFCTQRMYCSTCRKTGADFPRCGKCGETWCSRSCRLVGGKRHVCGSRI